MVSPRFAFQFVFVVLSTLLFVACGGDDDDGDSADRSPNSFSFTAQTDVTPGAIVESNTVVISGINRAVDLQISGGEYALEGGEFTTQAGTIENGQSLTVRVTASNEFAETVSATVTAGDQQATFSATTVSRDIEPAAFTFESVEGALRGEVLQSNAVTIMDINDAAEVSVVGGEYAIDGGDFTAMAGTIESGQTLTVRQAAGMEFGAVTTATVTVGGVEGTFAVTAEAQDLTPDDFAFMPVMDSAPGETVISDAVTIDGINDAATVSVGGGLLSIDGGDFVSEPQSVTAGQSVRVQGVASAEGSGAVTVALTVGEATENFVITTRQDVEAPTVAIVFPPPISMTEGDVIKVRGTASDEFSAISQLQVNGVDVTDTSDDGSYSTWTVDVPLEEGMNDLVASVVDSSTNSSDSAAEVVIKRDPSKGFFPESENTIDGPRAMLWLDENTILFSHDDGVDTFDITTGRREIYLADDESTPEPLEVDWATSMFLDDSALYLSDRSKLLKVDLETQERTDLTFHLAENNGKRTIIYNFFEIPGNEDEVLLLNLEEDFTLIRYEKETGNYSIIDDSNGVTGGDIITGAAYVPEENKFLIMVYNGGFFYLDIDTGEITEFPSIDYSDNPLLDPEEDKLHLYYDRLRNRAIFTVRFARYFITLDLTSGERSLFSHETNSSSFNQLSALEQLLFHENGQLMFVSDARLNSIFAIDAVSGERVFVFKGL